MHAFKVSQTLAQAGLLHSCACFVVVTFCAQITLAPTVSADLQIYLFARAPILCWQVLVMWQAIIWQLPGSIFTEDMHGWLILD